MADRPGERAGSESAEAVRDAAARLKSPEVQGTIRTALSDGDPDPRGLEPEPDDDGGQEEPDPAALAAEPEDEEAEPGSDYDPEKAAEYPDDDEPTPEQPPRQEPTTEVSEEERALLEKYPDDASRLRALAEFERLRSGEPSPSPEPEEEPGAKRFVPRPGAEPRNDDITAIVQELTQEDPELARAVDGLVQQKEVLKSGKESLDQQYGQIGELQSKVRDLTAIHRHATERLSKIPEDDVAAREMKLEEVRQARADLDDARLQLADIKFNYNEAKENHGEVLRDYEAGLQRIRNRGLQEYELRAQQSQEQGAATKAYNETKAERDAALPSVMKELGIPESMKAAFKNRLASMVDHGPHRASDEDLEPGRIKSWMLKAGNAVKAEYDQIRQEAVREYGDRKRSDVAQPAPRQPVATQVRRDRPLSARDADRQAARQLKESMRGARA